MPSALLLVGSVLTGIIIPACGLVSLSGLDLSRQTELFPLKISSKISSEAINLYGFLRFTGLYFCAFRAFCVPFPDPFIFRTKCDFLLPLRQHIFRQQARLLTPVPLPFSPSFDNSQILKIRIWTRRLFSGFAFFLPPRRTFSLFERCSTARPCADK